MRTLDEVAACDREMLTLADVCPVIGCDPQSVRIQLKEHPNSLRWCYMIGTRTMVPRDKFLDEHGWFARKR